MLLIKLVYSLIRIFHLQFCFRCRRRDSAKVKIKPLFPQTMTIDRYIMVTEGEGKDRESWMEMETFTGKKQEDNSTEDVLNTGVNIYHGTLIYHAQNI